jgi:hypothetical protein
MSAQLRFPWLPAPVGRISRRRLRAFVPRMAPAALRIPKDQLGQLPLHLVAPGGPQIFIHEGARQGLERRLETAFGGPVQLAVTDNLRRMITHTRARGTLRVRVHMMFLGADERILQALVDYVVHGDRVASQLIGEFIDRNTHRIRASRPVPGPLRTRGQAHDLADILQRINDTYFGGMITDVLITWGRRTRPNGRQKRSSIKLGSYSQVERLIRVHPVLDKEWVPRYFLSYIVYHELLHHVIPEVRSAGRSLLHPPEFTQRERAFRHHERAIAWEQKHIDRLLRAR